MTQPDPETIRKRRIAGICSILLLAGGIALSFGDGSHEGIRGALLRVGILLGALWLVLARPPRWKRLYSNWVIFGGIISAVLVRQLKYMFPVLAILAVIALIARPRKRS